MTLSNAEKQRRHRDRRKAEGLIYIQGWVTCEQAAIIRRIMADQPTNYAPVPDPAPAVVTSSNPLSPTVAFRLLDHGNLSRPEESAVLLDGQEVARVWRAGFGWIAATLDRNTARKGATRDEAVQRLVRSGVTPQGER